MCASGVIFLGTPHRGSQAIFFAAALAIASSAGFSGSDLSAIEALQPSFRKVSSEILRMTQLAPEKIRPRFKVQ